MTYTGNHPLDISIYNVVWKLQTTSKHDQVVFKITQIISSQLSIVLLGNTTLFPLYISSLKKDCLCGTSVFLGIDIIRRISNK